MKKQREALIFKPAGTWRARLGETPVWCERTRSLIWVDILANTLLRYWPEDAQRCQAISLPFLCSAALLTDATDQLLLVTECGIRLYDTTHDRFERLCDWPESAATRPNEAAIAPDGALWFSTMDKTARQAIGSWYRFTLTDPAPRCMLGQQWVPNTLVWHNNSAWFMDSFRHRLFQSSAEAIDARPLRSWPLGKDIADGSAITEDGILLNARWGQSCLARIQLAAQGPQLLERLPLPVRQPTSAVFGGDNFNELFITSARTSLASPGELDGALLHGRSPWRGEPGRRFRLLFHKKD